MSIEPVDDTTIETRLRVNFSKEDIGGELLPILTRGLYRDTLDCLREYIQNAIDAKANEITVSVDPDVVSVSDDGMGMDEDEARKAMRLGISEKNPLVNIGFRGIGIYSGFNLCDLLEIFTKSTDSDLTYRLVFDFKQIRKELLAEQKQRSQGEEPSMYLQRLLEKAIFMEPTRDGIIQSSGTRVIMSGLLPEAYRRVNDWNDVVDYLQNVVPLPFSPEFSHGKAIKEKFDVEDYRVVPLTLKIGARSQSLYRPYTDSVFRHRRGHPPEFFELRDCKHKFGFAWVCINDARATIKDLGVRGLLIKKFGFSIGDRRYLESYFGRTVYSRRITGEIIIKNPDLIPNAARSDFEHNTVRQVFAESLPKFTRKVDSWANEIQELERAKEVLAELNDELVEINSILPTVQRDGEQLLKLNSRLSDIDRRLKPHEGRLKKEMPDELDKCKKLLDGNQSFVREALTVHRQDRQQMEKEVIKSVQREALKPTPAEKQRKESVPTDLINLLDAYSLLESGSLRRFLLHLDENVLKLHLTVDRYSQIIQELRDYLEENP